MAEKLPLNFKLQFWVTEEIANAVEAVAAEMYCDTSTLLRQVIVAALRQHGFPLHASQPIKPTVPMPEDRVGA
jgi:hypothetical protein